MTSRGSLQEMPGLGFKLPTSPLIEEAALFVEKHCDEFVYNHAVRCAYWAVLIAKTISKSGTQSVDIDLIVIICILHDMGLAKSKADALPGLSLDKRFEVDGANIARDFIASHTVDAHGWNAARLDRLWVAIALHTTPSIALHAIPEVALAHQAITADFAGPYWSPECEGGGPVSMEEYRIITNTFPRGDFNREGLKKVMCGLCREKPETTYDNFVGLFGRNFGYDGKGLGREEYAQHWEDNQVAEPLLQSLDALDKLDASC
ncbi:hypothetical protein N0V93_002711 [Gnomoniopsis smithogilvyi]|uniref:HD domain-containing protein n=1 Tax=Gnomoniopsis smithogilvyi TaxID=1191159 RepID=A0A9W8YVA1_9PEZI|nr:hypothetical protein N0V93_002711 [Gnomoniopsis smithogilvyi]